MKIQAKNAKWYLQHLEAIAFMERYGDPQKLNGYVPTSLDVFDAAKVFAKLRRIETRAHRQYEHFCNVGCTDEERDAFDAKITKAVLKLLPFLPPEQFHLNGDPRGYALKVESEYAKHFRGIHRDFGGYGILAPEF